MNHPDSWSRWIAMLNAPKIHILLLTACLSGKISLILRYGYQMWPAKITTSISHMSLLRFQTLQKLAHQHLLQVKL